MTATMTRTTITLPRDLLDQIDRAVEEGGMPSRNAFIAAAVRHELAAAEAAAIDAEFALMAEDSEYQAEAQLVSQEFALADWEAFRLSEPER